MSLNLNLAQMPWGTTRRNGHAMSYVKFNEIILDHFDQTIFTMKFVITLLPLLSVIIPVQKLVSHFIPFYVHRVTTHNQA